MLKEVEIFTDGSCSGNPGKGGWAALLRYKEVERMISGSESYTTNNRMELLAVIKAIEQLKYPCKISITSDSQYVLNGITNIQRWKLKGWNKIKNAEMWIHLSNIIAQHEVSCKWVRGHAGHRENELVDSEARRQTNFG